MYLANQLVNRRVMKVFDSPIRQCLMAALTTPLSTAMSTSTHNHHNFNPTKLGAFSLVARENNGRRNFHTTLQAKKRSKRNAPCDGDTDDGLALLLDPSDASSAFATDYHAPVMCIECIKSLLGCQREHNRVFLDATLGGGGHSLALLDKLNPGDVLFGCDVDPDALQTASKRLETFIDHGGADKPLFVPIQSNFCDLQNALPSSHPLTNEPLHDVDGILMDLGVSSYQINTAERGFAFMKEGPLDMRMGKTSAGVGSLAAADICNEFPEDEIKRILKQYGDEARCKYIARSIVEHRPLTTTTDLVNAVAAVTPEFAKNRRKGRTATLARVFQALRIVVNQEDRVLEKALINMCPSLIRPGGRLVVLSYHSMEDRAVKRVMRDGTVGVRPTDERDIYGNYIGTPRPWRTIGKRQRATDGEIEVNPRARSAMLRVAERADTDQNNGN